jgi:hypothetical protein
MVRDGLSHAKKALQALAERSEIDPAARDHLAAIGAALEEAETRLQALEAVVEELAVGAQLKHVRGSNSLVPNLLGTSKAAPRPSFSDGLNPSRRLDDAARSG